MALHVSDPVQVPHDTPQTGSGPHTRPVQFGVQEATQ
jgi:hypothetical protein